jgi:hypothetical protein
MSNRRKAKKPSLLKRLVYLLVFASGGTAGLGGWAIKDHPRVQAVWTLLTGKPVDPSSPAPGGSLVSQAIDVLAPHADFRSPGVYRVTIRKVELDEELFKPGHTVDIQSAVQKIDSHGRRSTLWDSRPYGERLAVVGKDELSAGWPNRPFQVEWKPGDRLVLEVSDRKTGLFTQPSQFSLAASDPSDGEFPLRTGDFPLEPAQEVARPLDPRRSHVVLRSERAGELAHQAQTDVAERPIVIK